mmetsp:Transcript_27393/g.86838  ORF Transcript_27393/g.86838 Transcript_27393/m.86838 type:complete len:329 (-) Transcript_27393:67-1053(-)|eukprot:CAMPEP_0118886598 /NCGR_PEP_ID=MMETSP1163-20130328/24630_1 /TAXON_ID=124430 /ORGANISM="Phaeomonas parva, Strain CCMP2877" /LENGTH=328 /DNA_ID=CAMNT_0006824859 /DNA_START=404 /DNA_END=1390 /DNA_ORIENTATION=-
MNAEDDGLTDYERQRAENIKRNEQMLKSLGLENDSRKRPRRNPKPKPKPKAKLKVEPQEPLRRSSRNLGVPAPQYSEKVYAELDRWERAESNPKAAKRRRPAPSPSARAADAKPITKFQAKSDVNFARDMDIDVEAFVSNWLGKEMPAFGKACVMSTAAAAVSIGVAEPKDGAAASGVVPRFNKYSGVAEWSNALFLFVNIGGADYANNFLEGGQSITWFGGSRMHPDTKVVKRLLQYGRAAANPTPDTKPHKATPRSTTPTPVPRQSSIVLLCRFQGEPYVCCGRLAYVEHSELEMPLRFVWRLMDADALLAREKGRFLDMLRLEEE